MKRLHPPAAALTISLALGLGTAPAHAAGDAPAADGAGTACALAPDTLAALAAGPSDGLPDSPAGEQLRWVLEAGPTANVDEVSEHFAAALLDIVPAEQLVPILAAVGAAEPTVGEVTTLSTTDLIAVLDSSEGAVIVTIAVDPAPPHQIVGLLFQPESTAEPLAADAETITAALAAAPGESRLLVAEYVDTPDDGSEAARFEDVLVIDADTSAPIGSAFKLWVLGALGEAITAGDVSWSDELRVDDAVRSLPSGVLQDCPDGSTVTIADAAALMIAISDNTATDALISLVGREAVEHELGPAGVSDEAIGRMLPLLTTQELFHLKFDGEIERLERYVSGSVDERRAILDELPSAPPAALELREPGDPMTVPAPVAIDTVEWFASPRDLANTLARLDGLAAAPELGEVDDILGRSPGIALDDATWSNAWFKGGSEPGVLTLAWLLTRADGRQFVVVVMHTDTESAMPVPEIELVADAAIRLAAEHA